MDPIKKAITLTRKKKIQNMTNPIKQTTKEQRKETKIQEKKGKIPIEGRSFWKNQIKETSFFI